MRDSFLGTYRTETNPIAVERGECAQQRRSWAAITAARCTSA